MPEILTYIDPYGRTRKGKESPCLNCEKLFIHRIDRNGKFCNEKCCNEYKRKISTRYIELPCTVCNKEFKRRKDLLVNSKSGLYFCSRKCKEFGQSLAGGIKEIQPPHYGTAGIDYRALFTEDELVCVRCGYDEFKSCVDIHHIDHNRENNDKSNLIPLCCNCHHGIHRGCWKFEDLSLRALV